MPEQLDAAIGCRPASITLDYLELYGLRPSVEKIHRSGIEPRVASPRILKPNEERVVHFLLSLECPLLVRSGGLLYSLNGLLGDGKMRPLMFGDFSLNAANAISVAAFLQMNLKRISPTHDLNAQQIVDLARRIDATCLEVIAYHQLPVFHMEHCVFCRFLSTGTDHTNCGHPCEQHRVAVRDVRGRRHPVIADVGCRNTVFNAEAQSAVPYLQQMIDAGIQHFRLEFVHHNAATTGQICEAFLKFFCQEISAPELRRQLSIVSPQPTTDGSLYVPETANQLVQLH
jgi:putative protease